MKIKNWWDTFVERIIRAPQLRKRELLAAGGATPTLMDRAPIDESANDKALVDAREDNPLYRALMDQAYALAGNYLTAAEDVELPKDQRLANLDRAFGLRDFIGNVEVAREKLQEKRLKRQLQEEGIARAKEARERSKTKAV